MRKYSSDRGFGVRFRRRNHGLSSGRWLRRRTEPSQLRPITCSSCSGTCWTWWSGSTSRLWTTSKLIEASLKGMLSSLDPHSDYLSPTDFQEMEDTTRGEYGGLGIEITSDEAVIKIISPIDGTSGGARGTEARRLYHRGKRRERARFDRQRRGQADARQGRRVGDPDDRPREDRPV